ncbi:hypothetical protein VUR80DRAFT_8825 [Thermomyces stellatus]
MTAMRSKLNLDRRARCPAAAPCPGRCPTHFRPSAPTEVTESRHFCAGAFLPGYARVGPSSRAPSTLGPS